MKKWLVFFTLALLAGFYADRAQARVFVVQEAPATQVAPSLSMQVVSFSGDEMVVKTTISDPEQVFGYGFVVNYNPTEYEFVGQKNADKLGFILVNEYQGPGRIGVTSVTLTDAKGNKVSLDPEVSLVFRKKTEAWGQLKLTGLNIWNSDKQKMAVRNPSAFTPTSQPQAVLLDNYPNPFNPSTEIRFEIPSTTDDAKLAVYDMLGREVRTLVSGKIPAGHYIISWDGKDEKGRRVGSGVYFYRLQGADWSVVRKMTLLK